jgi:hypothetical protein
MVSALTTLQPPPQFTLRDRVAAIRVLFNRQVDVATVTAAPSAADLSKASFRVTRAGRLSFVPGTIVPDGPQAVRFVITEPPTFRSGQYTVELFGDADPGTGRPAIAEQNTHFRMDGEIGAGPSGLPSGQGDEGGNFTFNFVITD